MSDHILQLSVSWFCKQSKMETKLSSSTLTKMSYWCSLIHHPLKCHHWTSSVVCVL